MRKLLLRLGLSFFTFTLLLCAVEGAASLWSKWAVTGLPPPVREAAHCEYDPELGWRHIANKRVTDLYAPGVGLTTNGQHMRGTRDHAPKAADGKYRILCLGDSFTMGYGVADDESYPELLAQEHPSLDTVNMGLGGYGIDQCYLWYERDGTKFDTDVLLFTIIVGDFYRMNPEGNVADIAKPVLQLVNGDPVAINVPVANILQPGVLTRLGRVWQSSCVSSLLPRTLAAPTASPLVGGVQPFVPVSLRIFEILRDQSRQRGQRFVLALLPVLEEVGLERIDLVDVWLRPALEERGIAFLDLRPAFQQVPKSELPACFAHGHYSRRGNLIAARALLAGIRALDPACPR